MKLKEPELSKMSTLMYFLIKNAARSSFVDFLKELDLTLDDYNNLRDIMIKEFGISKPYL